MKTIHMAAAVLLAAGLSTAAYAGMGKCGTGKCGGSATPDMTKTDFAAKKSGMLERIDHMRACVESARNTADLKACRQKMVRKMQEMRAKKQTMKCGAGKCGGGTR